MWRRAGTGPLDVTLGDTAVVSGAVFDTRPGQDACKVVYTSRVCSAGEFSVGGFPVSDALGHAAAASLTAEFAYRYSDYSYGKQTNTYKAGGDWEPIDGLRLRALRLLGGLTVRARMFIDATYEGDLMAKAGVSYRNEAAPAGFIAEMQVGDWVDLAMTRDIAERIARYDLAGAGAVDVTRDRMGRLVRLGLPGG